MRSPPFKEDVLLTQSFASNGRFFFYLPFLLLEALGSSHRCKPIIDSVSIRWYGEDLELHVDADGDHFKLNGPVFVLAKDRPESERGVNKILDSTQPMYDVNERPVEYTGKFRPKNRPAPEPFKPQRRYKSESTSTEARFTIPEWSGDYSLQIIVPTNDPENYHGSFFKIKFR